MNQLLAFIQRHSSDIFCAANISANIIYSNDSWTHFTDYSANESYGKNLADLAHPADRNRVKELFQSITELKKTEGFHCRIATKAGVFLNVTWSICLDDAEQIVYASGIYINEKLNIRNPNNISDKMQHILANLTEGFFMLDHKWRINAFNPAFQKLVCMRENELYGADFRLMERMSIAEEVVPAFENVYKNQTAVELKYYDCHCKCWFRLDIYAYKGELIVFVRDISYEKIEQLILELEKKVLVLNLMPDYPLAKMAEELLLGIESIFPEMYCSILELDPEQEHVYHLSAPRLPAEYNIAINGEPIGPYAGSCGTAAYHREQVIVKDIANSPLWEKYKQLILPYGFKACWSTPVISAGSSKVLATFAIYYRTIREPVKDELRMIERTVNVLRTLIERRRNEEHLAEQTRRLQEIAAISSHDIRRPVATILGLVNLFDKKNPSNPLNSEIVQHLESTASELDDVIHVIVEKTINV
jgi:PAS domain S-box-containing protein